MIAHTLKKMYRYTVWYVTPGNPLKNSSIKLTKRVGSSVVECLTRDREAVGSSLTGVTALWSLSKTHLS